MAGERHPQPRPTHAHGNGSRLETCVAQGTQWGAAHPALDPRACLVDPGTHESERGRHGFTCNRIPDEWEMCSVKRGGSVKTLRVGPCVVTVLAGAGLRATAALDPAFRNHSMLPGYVHWPGVRAGGRGVCHPRWASETSSPVCGLTKRREQPGEVNKRISPAPQRKRGERWRWSAAKQPAAVSLSTMRCARFRSERV